MEIFRRKKKLVASSPKYFQAVSPWKYFGEVYRWERSLCSTDDLNLEHYTLNAEQFLNGKDRMLLREIRHIIQIVTDPWVLVKDFVHHPTD